jgi:hypothetical protein
VFDLRRRQKLKVEGGEGLVREEVGGLVRTEERCGLEWCGFQGLRGGGGGGGGGGGDRER